MQQQAQSFDLGPEHVAIWTSDSHYWLCKEAAASDFDGDLIERDGRLLVIVGTGVFPSRGSPTS